MVSGEERCVSSVVERKVKVNYQNEREANYACMQLQTQEKAYHIDELIHDNSRLASDDVRMFHVDGYRRKVYIKFTSDVLMPGF